MDQHIVTSKDREDLRKETQKYIRRTYLAMAKHYTAAAHWKLFLMRLMNAAASFVLIVAAALILKSADSQKGLYETLCTICCMGTFPWITAQVFTWMNSRQPGEEYSVMFFTCFAAALIEACIVVQTMGLISVPLLGIPLFFTTVRIQADEGFMQCLGKARRCEKMAYEFVLSMEDFGSLLSGKTFAAENGMFTFRLEKLTECIPEETEKE